MSTNEGSDIFSSPRIDMNTTVDELADGATYYLHAERFPAEETTFTSLVKLESLIVKMPTPVAEEDFTKYLVSEEHTGDDVRPSEPLEQRRHLKEALAAYPDLAPLAHLSESVAHLAVVHKIQHERLKAGGVIVPITRFGAVQTSDTVIRFAAFQQRISGVALLDMFDQDRHQIRSEYKTSLATISRQLSELLQSPLRGHINWYIKNFIIDKSFEFFTYVDCKPSSMFGARGNLPNINGLVRYFGVQDSPSVLAIFLRKLLGRLGLVRPRG